MFVHDASSYIDTNAHQKIRFYVALTVTHRVFEIQQNLIC